MHFPEDPTELARSGRLDVVAKRLVEGLKAGKHRSSRKGISVEFLEHRPYVLGDEIRHIDWRVWGKTNRYHVKQYEEETHIVASILVDASGSMAYQGKFLRKYDYACQMAAALSYLLLSQRDAVALTVFSGDRTSRQPPSSQLVSFERLVQQLGASQPEGESALAQTLQGELPAWTRPRLVLLLTDAFEPLGALADVLRQASRAGHDVVLWQIVAPEEADFPFQEGMLFQDLEKAHVKVSVDPYRLATLYQANFRRHQAELTALARAAQIDLTTVRTNQPYSHVLADYLERRQRRLSR